MASDDTDRLVVPKFGSFKSQPTEAPKAADSLSAEKGRDESKRSHSRHHDEGRRRRHRSRDEPRRRQHGTSHRSKESNAKHEARPTRDTSEAQAKSFVIDTKGDPLIRRYGTLDRAQIPAYRRYGYGRVLGTKGRLVIYHEGVRDYFSLRMPGEGLPRYRDRDGLRTKRPSAHPAPVALRKHITSSKDDEDEKDGYIPMGGSRKRKLEPDSSDEDERPSYRSIEGKAKAGNVDSDAESESDDAVEIDESDLNNPLKWKSIQLNRTVKEQPANIDAWLELADHQDELLRAQSVDGLALDNEAHSYKEIKVSMLESALENVKAPSDKERVLVELMREGSAVWPSKVAAKKWADLGDHVKSHALWKVQIDFMMTNVVAFQYDAIKTTFIGRLHFVLSTASSEVPDGYREALYVFLRTTRFIHDSGYRELAVAAWQAMLELSFFRPDSDQQPTSVPASFQEFWESEVPRVGDYGATGWNQFVTSGGQGEPPEPVTQPAMRESASRDTYKLWANLESEHAGNATMPARTMDDGTDDDPFRVVTYSDIEPLLFMIPKDIIPNLSAALISAYLLFCGLPPPPGSEAATEYYQDQFISPSGCEIPQVASTPSQTESEELQRKVPYADRCHVRVAWASDVLFCGKNWFRLLDTQTIAKSVDLAWVDAVLKRLVYDAKAPIVSEYYLAFAYAQDATSVKKVARSLIKQDPNNMNLYNYYALAEFSNSNAEVATKVLGSATASPLVR